MVLVQGTREVWCPDVTVVDITLVEGTRDVWCPEVIVVDITPVQGTREVWCPEVDRADIGQDIAKLWCPILWCPEELGFFEGAIPLSKVCSSRFK